MNALDLPARRTFDLAALAAPARAAPRGPALRRVVDDTDGHPAAAASWRTCRKAPPSSRWPPPASPSCCSSIRHRRLPLALAAPLDARRHRRLVSPPCCPAPACRAATAQAMPDRSRRAAGLSPAGRPSRRARSSGCRPRTAGPALPCRCPASGIDAPCRCLVLADQIRIEATGEGEVAAVATSALLLAAARQRHWARRRRCSPQRIAAALVNRDTTPAPAAAPDAAMLLDEAEASRGPAALATTSPTFRRLRRSP